EVAQVIERRAALPQRALLLDRGGLGIALRHDQAAQGGAVLPRYLLPGRLAAMGAEADAAIGLRLGEEDAPAIVRHADMAEIRPALRVDADRRAQIDLGRGCTLRPELAPPVEIARLPGLQRAQQAAVAGEVDVVRNPF